MVIDIGMLELITICFTIFVLALVNRWFGSKW